MDITVVGLGVVGGESFKEFSRLAMGDRVIGVDIDEKKLAEFRPRYNVSRYIPQSDVYIIATYTTEQAKQVLNGLDLVRKPLISLESTLDPREYGYFSDWAKKTNADLVTCPHRFNPNDKEHHVFNLDRVLGGTTVESTGRGIEFYTRFSARDRLHDTNFNHAALSKTMENAYRFLQIDTAQIAREFCEQNSLDFVAARNWIHSNGVSQLLDAKDGIKGTCLPKDVRLIAESTNDPLWAHHVKHNDKYALTHEKPLDGYQGLDAVQIAQIGLAANVLYSNYGKMVDSYCKENGFDARELRRLMNTKWNIKVASPVSDTVGKISLQNAAAQSTIPLLKYHLRRLDAV